MEGAYPYVSLLQNWSKNAELNRLGSTKMAAITHVYVCCFFTEQRDCHVTEYKLSRGDLRHAIIIGYFCVLSFHL